MSINDFRRKSKEGGFDCEALSDSEMLLNPNSFKAVGKVEGWRGTQEVRIGKRGPSSRVWTGEWYDHMHRMIDSLAEGKTVSSFLETL